ncbi:MAG: hypothetical protein Q8M88_12170 [Phenylobacterium sp.]|uniref:hypothetical protein n=1 Tax=Phenylobacterium sp. TaxID=1871053 RepID=UPI002732D355|nr:hypothetical protein [Phenylobacterium sp.]MDP3175178.1 hypothetical protein [Phenylobacterium sp.]
MAVWTIDGVVEAAELRRRKGKYVFYDSVRIREADGAEQTLTKVSAADPVAAALQPGARGRFFVTKAMDQTGIHAIRLEGGKDAYAHFTNIEPLVLIGAAAGFIFYPVALAGGSVPLFGLPLLLAPLLLLSWWLFRKARLEGLQQYGAAAPADAT